MYVCVHIYIWIEREREREREIDMYEPHSNHKPKTYNRDTKNREIIKL